MNRSLCSPLAVVAALLAVPALSACDLLFGPLPTVVEGDPAREGEGEEGEGDEGEGEGDAGEGEGEGEGGEGEGEGEPVGCTAITVSAQTATIDATNQNGIVSGTSSNGLEVQFQVYGPQTPGQTFVLSGGDNANFSTCSQCVIAFTSDQSQIFFQSGGAGDLNADPYTDNVMDGALFDVTLVEVTVDETTFASTPVPGGACFTISNYAFSQTATAP